MTDKPADSLIEVIGLSTEDAQRIVAAAAHHYFDSRRSRVDAFVDRHFSFKGSAAMHRKALGWDIAAPWRGSLPASFDGAR
jgi:hypothetical protein